MAFEQGGCVYIMTNKRHTVLYVGVTSNLITRAWEHKNKVYLNSFTAKYHCEKLVYYCPYSRIEEAIAAEKMLKAGKRIAKIKLIEGLNPEWIDLYDQLVKE